MEKQKRSKNMKRKALLALALVPLTLAAQVSIHMVSSIKNTNNSQIITMAVSNTIPDRTYILIRATTQPAPLSQYGFGSGPFAGSTNGIFHIINVGTNSARRWYGVQDITDLVARGVQIDYNETNFIDVPIEPSNFPESTNNPSNP